MTDGSIDQAGPGAVTPAGAPAGADAGPIVFEAAGSWCFGWFHAARSRARGMGVVLCRPFGYEAVCTYRTYTALAQTLADGGFDVLRFDYHGTGDSAGSDTDPGRVAAWIDSIASAVTELKRRSGVSHIALFGVRLGATLAARAATRLGGVDSLVLWAPCTGRAFARELRAASANRGGASMDGAAGDAEALGYRYTAQTLQDLQALDGGPAPVAPARRVLIIPRDDLPGAATLPTQYRDLGVEVTCAAWPGYAGMMVEPHEAVLPHGTLHSISEWLGTAPVPAPQPQLDPLSAPGQVLRQIAAPAPVDSVLEGVRETPLVFGAHMDLFGILAEPAAPQPGDRRGETAILMLSVGGTHRIGPNRNYVRFARALAASGWRTLRLDLAGVGDSRTAAGFSRASMYSTNATEDVRAAIDSLSERGCKRFYLMGICSGSYVAFQTALVDARVNGQLLMNTRLLEWHGKEGDTWETAMQRAFKSTDFYRRSLMKPQVYWRVVRGQVDVNGIAARVRSVIQARLKRALDRVLRWEPAEESLLAKFRHLSERGTDTLMLVSEEDDGRDYVEFHFGTRGRRLRADPNFRMVLVQDADHTFSRSHAQQFVLAVLREHLEARCALVTEPTPVYLKGAKMLGAG